MTAASRPRAVVVSGFGLNCETETAHAFALAGAVPEVVHLPDLVDAPERLRDVAILALPGGFSFGDHLGAGNALASYLRDRLRDALEAHLARGGLVVGICNGCQTLVRLGLMGTGVALAPNRRDDRGGDYECRWVRVAPGGGAIGPWLDGIGEIELPIAHGEGRFAGENLAAPALVYADDGGRPTDAYPRNPNGSHGATAAITAHGGRVLALMPHPERFVRAEQHPQWTLRREIARRGGARVPERGDGLMLFANAVANA